MVTTITARHEAITGASCTGSDSDSNRTYILTNTGAQKALFIINVQGAVWQQDTDWTLTADVITFINPIYDIFTITLDYFTGTGTLAIAGGYGYCDSNDVYRLSGITSDTVSVTDVNAHILNAEVFACRYTRTVYWKNNLDNQPASSGGASTITKTSAGWITDDFQNQYVYIYSGIGLGQIRQITSNTSDTLTVDRDWDTNPDNTSKFRVFYAPIDFPPYVSEALDGSGLTYQFMPWYPVQILESLSISGTTITPTNVYQWKNTGKLQFKTTAEASIFSRTYPQEVSIAYWYGVTSLPYDIKRLVELKAAMSVLGQQMGGTFDDPSTVGLPEFNVSIGQAYINIRSSLETIKEEYKELLNMVKVWPVFG